jgi:methionine-rich copper-binding protein CopC
LARAGRLICLLLVIAFVPAAIGCGSGSPRVAETTESTSPPEHTAPPPAEPPPPFQQENFTLRRTINFVGTEPENNQLLTSPVDGVTIYFSHNLGSGTFAKVTRNGLEVNDGPMEIAMDLRSVRAPVKADVTGNYKVEFAAYFSDGYYEEGSFGFSVNLE